MLSSTGFYVVVHGHIHLHTHEHIHKAHDTAIKVKIDKRKPLFYFFQDK